MNETKPCWNCRAAVIQSAKECAFCYAGLDPEARGLSSERAAEEQKRLSAVSSNPTPPPAELGCLAVVGAILAGIVTVALVAAIVGNTGDDQPCTGGASDCGEFLGTFSDSLPLVVAVVICSSFYIWMADRIMTKKRRSYEATQTETPPPN